MFGYVFIGFWIVLKSRYEDLLVFSIYEFVLKVVKRVV